MPENSDLPLFKWGEEQAKKTEEERIKRLEQEREEDKMYDHTGALKPEYFKKQKGTDAKNKDETGKK